MWRSLTLGKNKRAWFRLTRKHCSEVKNGAHIIARPPSSSSKLYSLYRCPTRRNTLFALYRTKKNLYNAYAENFFVLSRCNNMTLPAQIAWKRLLQICSYSKAAFPLCRIVCAVRLAVTSSHLVVRWVFAFIVGKVTCTQGAWADVESNPIGNNLYMHAQDRHVHMTSSIISVLEGFVLFTRAIGNSLRMHVQDGHLYCATLIFSVIKVIVLFMRAIYLGILFSPSIALAPFADSYGAQFRKTWLRLVHVTLEKAGPAFIKWGQWAATRPDLFPEDLCIELSKLHSKAPEHSFTYTEKAIEKAFGCKLSEIFEEFEEAPMASGSVAQVHRARLKFRYPGKQANPIVVAVKVRHPGVGESISKDLLIIKTLAKFLNFIPTLKWLRLDESVGQFSVCMMSQVDLTREAAKLNRFIYNFRKCKDVSFPEPLLVHPAVLVETYEEGESVSHYIADAESERGGRYRTKHALADIGTCALLKMLLVDNLIHADLHPGNILVRVAQGKPHVIFLDVGMTTELSRSDQVNLLEFFKAVAERDGRAIAECTLRLSKKQNCPNPKAFVEDVEKSFTFWGITKGDAFHPAACVHRLLEKVRYHRVNVDGNVCALLITTSVHEDWQRKLDPDYNAMRTLQTMFLKADWAGSLLYTILALMAP